MPTLNQAGEYYVDVNGNLWALSWSLPLTLLGPIPLPVAPPQVMAVEFDADGTAQITDVNGNIWNWSPGGKWQEVQPSSITINPLTGLVTGTGFNVTGTLSNVNQALTYSDDGGATQPVPLPGVTATTFAFLHAAESAGPHTLTVATADGKTTSTITYQVAAPTSTESPDQTWVKAGSGGSITDASGNIWTISTGAQVVLNGVVQVQTSNVTDLYYEWTDTPHRLWQTSPGPSKLIPQGPGWYYYSPGQGWFGWIEGLAPATIPTP